MAIIENLLIMQFRSLFNTVSIVAADFRQRNPPKRVSQFQLALKAADLFLVLWIGKLSAQCFFSSIIYGLDHVIYIESTGPDFR